MCLFRHVQFGNNFFRTNSREKIFLWCTSSWLILFLVNVGVCCALHELSLDNSTSIDGYYHNMSVIDVAIYYITALLVYFMGSKKLFVLIFYIGFVHNS